MEREEFKIRLGRLVELQTLSGNIPENSKALDLIESWADPSLKRMRVRNGNAEILLLGTENLLNPKYGYLVHADVVSAADSKLFTMTEKDGKLFGRGVSDMKYSIPIGVSLLSSFSKLKKQPDFTLAITTDEEIGGGEGGNHLANEMKFKPDVLIVPDGGDGFVFVNKSKGVAHIWIESKGKPTHASTPWLGKNALTPLVSIANQLGNIYDQNSKSPNWQTTMNLGILQGGKSTNQVCDDAVLKLDFRFPESRSVVEIFDEVKTIARNTDSALNVKLAAQGDPTYTDIKHPEVARFLNIAKSILGRDIKVEGENGASDARYWAKYNIPIIITKPVGGGIHSENEWIDIESCLTYFKILYSYISDSQLT